MSSLVNIQQNKDQVSKKYENTLKEQVKVQIEQHEKLQTKFHTITLEQEPEEAKNPQPLRETFGKYNNQQINQNPIINQKDKKIPKAKPSEQPNKKQPTNTKSSSEKDFNLKYQNSFSQPKQQPKEESKLLGHSHSEQQYHPVPIAKESQKESFSFKGLSSVEESVSQQNALTPNAMIHQMNQPSPSITTPLRIETISDHSKGFPYMHNVVQGPQQVKQDVNDAQIIDTLESRDVPFSPKVETIHSHYKYKDVVPPLDLQNISGSKSNISINKDLKGVKSQNSLFNQEQEKKQKPVFQEQQTNFKSPFKSIPFNKSPQGQSKPSNKDVSKQTNQLSHQHLSSEKNKSASLSQAPSQNFMLLNHITDSEDMSSIEGQNRPKVDDFLKQFDVFHKESAESFKNTLNTKLTGKAINIEDQEKREEGKQFLNTEGDKKYQIINGIKVLVLDEGYLSESPETQRNQSKVIQSKNQSLSDNLYQEVEIVEEEEEEVNNTLQTEPMNGQRNKVIPVQKRVSSQNFTQNSQYENEESEQQIQTSTIDYKGFQDVSPPPSSVKQFVNQGSRDSSPFQDIPRFNEQKIKQVVEQQPKTQIISQSKVVNYEEQKQKPKQSTPIKQQEQPKKIEKVNPPQKPQPQKQEPPKVQVEKQIYITEKQQVKKINGQEFKEHLIVEEEEEEDTQPNEIIRRPIPQTQGFFSGAPFDNKVKKEKQPIQIEEEQIIEESEEEDSPGRDKEFIRQNLRLTQKNLFDNFDKKVEKHKEENQEEHEIIVEEEEEEELEEDEKKLIQSQLRKTQQNSLIASKVETQKQNKQEDEEEIVIEEEEEEEESQNDFQPNIQRQANPFLKNQGGLVIQEKGRKNEQDEEEIIIVEEEEEEDDENI